jgi:uncharacterized protein with NRDE domain
LILIAWGAHARYGCVIAANRDEFHGRPSAAADWWPERPDILGGRDLAAGGTWHGITRQGRFAALTNFRGPQSPPPDPPSRGLLVSAWLKSAEPVPAALARLRRDSALYNGFNLLFSDGTRLAAHSSTTGEGRELGDGIYGLSNHLLDTPWHKLQRAKDGFRRALDGGAEALDLLAVLRDEREAPENELPDTGISRALERRLSRTFIRSPEYGTRCSTVIRIRHDRQVLFDEWNWTPSGEQIDRRRFEFPLEVISPPIVAG